REGAREWLLRAAVRYRESWDAGGAPDAWGRPIGAMKALLVAGADAGGAARWAPDAGAAGGGAPGGRLAGVPARPGPRRDSEAGALAATLGEEFPSDVAAALAAIATHDTDAARAAVASVRNSFETRAAFLEDIPVPDTALALDALAALRRLDT